MSYIVNFICGVIFIVVFFGVVYLANKDMQDSARLDAIDAYLASNETTLQKAARSICAAEAGHGAEAVWTPKGQLICKGVKR